MKMVRESPKMEYPIDNFPKSEWIKQDAMALLYAPINLVLI